MSIFDKKDFIVRTYRKILHKLYVNDIWLDLRLAAKKDSVEYALSQMQDALILNDRYALLSFALARAPQQGLVLEFGVEKGLSINHLARIAPGRAIDGFDSFEGLPGDWGGTMETQGKFDMRGKPPKVRDNVRLHVGLFDQTLPGFLRQRPDKVALAHIDCDIYESTVAALTLLEGRIEPGSVIVFDEYFNYPGWRRHEYKAFQEFIARTGLSYRYIGLSAEKGHVAVRIG